MDQEYVRQQLYKRYIEPTKKERKEYIGVEIEIPIINLSKEAVDFEIIHSITDSFLKKYNFEVTGIDDEGNIYSALNNTNGDILSYDCSYNNLEFSFGREKNLFIIQNRLAEYYTFLQNELHKYNYTLTGMGVNPYRKYNHNIPIPNGRYRMLFHHLNSYKKYLNLPMYFHNYPAYGTFSSASQVQLDISFDKLPMAINTFSKLEPIKALLFSNSVLLDEHEDILCARDMFWENSTHGINPHNIGMYDCEFSSAEELLSYIESTSIYCVERGDKYINFAPIKITEYFNRKSITGEYFENGEYKEIEVEPRIEDLEYLRTFKFEDLTFRGTIEFRSMCCQPIKDSMTVSAFHLGLMDNLDMLSDLLENDNVIYHHGYNATELRKLFLKYKLPEVFDNDDTYSLVNQVLDLSYDGLAQRGYGEEKLLQPLYERLKAKTNPAKTMIDLKNQGVDLQNIISEYAKL